MPKTDLFDIEIREFSAVPAGAHEGANAVLLKRRDPDDSKVDPIECTHDIDQAEIAQALLARLNKGETPMAPSAEELQAQVDRLTKIVGLTPAQRTHFDGLDEPYQDEFLSKAAPDRDAAVTAAVEAAKSADPVAYTTDDGMDIRKSAGEHVIALAKQLDATARENATLRKQAEQAALEKRATDELPNLGGTVQVRAAILSAIDGIADEAVRKAAHERLRAGSESLAKVFEPQGHGGAGEPVDGSAEAKLAALTKSYAEKHNVSLAKAEAAVLDTDEGNRLYTEAENEARASQPQA